MRIQFSLTCQKGTIIPINYQYEVSSWVFETLSKAGGDLCTWVEEKGFDLRKKNYKFFTFSPLAIFPYEMDQQRQEFRLLGNQVKISISLYLEPMFEHQVVGLFRQTPLRLGKLNGAQGQFEVKHWQILPRPNFREMMQFRCISPISVTSVDEVKGNNPYLMPDSEDYDMCFFNHAIRRFKASVQYRSLSEKKMLDPSYPLHFKLQSQPKSRLIHLRSHVDGPLQLRGFAYDFELAMTPLLYEFCYYAGFGENAHLGFGFADLR
jgi:CRISPR-associated endoribonuclease Cas6